MLKKSVVSGATLIVPDIEDSVPVSEKPMARKMINEYVPFIRANAIQADSVLITPRTNQPSIPELFYKDIDSIFYAENNCAKYIDGLCVPKIDTVEDIKKVHDVLDEFEKKHKTDRAPYKIIPQIESAASLINMKDIFTYDKERSKESGLKSSRVIAAAYGADDFTADLGVHRSDDDRELDFSRKLFALTCAAFEGIVSIDTPYVHFKNPEGLRTELTYLKEIGMKAKLAIHPTQVPIINEELCISSEEYSYYKEMIVQFEKAQIEEKKAAIVFHDKMVDIAAYRRAKELVSRWEQVSAFLQK